MTPEAQRAAVQRLALRGWSTQTISAETGITEREVRRYLADAGSTEGVLTPPSQWKARRIASGLSGWTQRDQTAF